MKNSNLLVVFISVLLLTSCSKSYIENTNPFIGEWNLVERTQITPIVGSPDIPITKNCKLIFDVDNQVEVSDYLRNIFLDSDVEYSPTRDSVNYRLDVNDNGQTDMIGFAFINKQDTLIINYYFLSDSSGVLTSHERDKYIRIYN
jgi:hypothetical protein